jgi:hypothetical protein
MMGLPIRLDTGWMKAASKTGAMLSMASLLAIATEPRNEVSSRRVGESHCLSNLISPQGTRVVLLTLTTHTTRTFQPLESQNLKKPRVHPIHPRQIQNPTTPSQPSQPTTVNPDDPDPTSFPCTPCQPLFGGEYDPTKKPASKSSFSNHAKHWGADLAATPNRDCTQTQIQPSSCNTHSLLFTPTDSTYQ